VAQPIDPEVDALERATLVSLAPKRGQRLNVLDAVLRDRDVVPAVAEIAIASAPTALRPPLAFARLARALGMRAAPVAVMRAFSLGELGAAADKQIEAQAILRDARVQNDGRVDVLITAAWPSGTPIDPQHGREIAAWERWAASPTPVPNEDARVLAGYVEMLVLDYLSANVARRSALLGEHALHLVDNATAFAPHPDGPTLDKLLRRIRAIARFPRGIRDALARFDRARAAAIFQEGAFETWLLTPRMLVEIEERRATLLTLLEAKIAERGAESVLCL
jgi:hypothetical protein